MGGRGGKSGLRGSGRPKANIPPGVRIQYSDGSIHEYRRGPEDSVANIDMTPIDWIPVSYTEFYNRAREGGFILQEYQQQDLTERDAQRHEERANRPDYEMGIGTEWGNANNRKAARQSRLAGRVARRKR